MKTFSICFSLLTVLGVYTAYAQEFTVRDRAEITYKSQLVLQELEALLNAVSNENITQSETGELIRNSYSGTANRIFRSERVVIEDDINPDHHNHTNRQDKKVGKYLEDLDLLYLKTQEPSIRFSNFQVSNLKQTDSLYVKVLFDSEFLSDYKGKVHAYQKTQRLAFVRAEKEDKQWVTHIVSIVFYDPAYPITDPEADVVIDETTAGDLTETMYRTSAAAVSVETLVKEETKKLFDQYTAKRDSAYKASLNRGEEALQRKEWDVAFQSFTEAQSINPYEITPRLKLNEVTKAVLDEKNSKQRAFDEALLQAERAYAVRNHTAAKNYYQQALLLKPDEPSLKARIAKLDAVIRNISLLESKFIAGEYEEAIKDYTKAIKADRTNPDYYLGRGKCYYELDNLKKTLSDYTTAIALDGNYIEALDRRAALYVQMQDLHKAIADLSIIITNQEFAADYLPKRAVVKELLRDLSGAIEDYAEAIALVPDRASNHFQKGLLHYQRQELDLAIASFDAVLRLTPANATAYYQRGMAYNLQGNVKQAARDFSEAVAKGLEKSFAIKIDEVANHYFNQGVDAQNRQDYEGAISHFMHALIIKPHFVEAWLKKGNSFYAMGDFETAITNYDMAVRYDDTSNAVYRRAEAYFNLKNYQQAATDFDHYVLIEPAKFTTYLYLGECLNKLQEYDKAAVSLQKAIKLQEKSPEAYYQLGFSFYHLQNYKLALNNLDEAIKKNKIYAEAYFLRGLNQQQLKDGKKAIRDIAKSIELGYKNSGSYLALGNAYMNNGDDKEAIQQYGKAIGYDTLLTEAFIHRAACLKNEKKYALAYNDYEHVLRLDDALNNDIKYLTNRGMVELYLNMLPQAEVSFDKALALREAGGWALYGKACVLARQDKLEDSFAFYEKAFQSKEISWTQIKQDELITSVAKNKKFKSLVKKYL